VRRKSPVHPDSAFASTCSVPQSAVRLVARGHHMSVELYKMKTGFLRDQLFTSVFIRKLLR
jgi:hypothetical protein